MAIYRNVDVIENGIVANGVHRVASFVGELVEAGASKVYFILEGDRSKAKQAMRSDDGVKSKKDKAHVTSLNDAARTVIERQTTAGGRLKIAKNCLAKSKYLPPSYVRAIEQLVAEQVKDEHPIVELIYAKDEGDATCIAKLKHLKRR